MRRALLGLLGVLIAGPALAGGSSPPGIVQGGSITAGHCAQFSANGVAIDSGGTCGTGTAGVTQSQGTSNQVLVNGDTIAHTGATTYSLPPNVTLGTNGGTGGSLTLNGATSGGAIILVPGTAGTPTLTLPTVTGSLLDSANNLSDIANAATARTNLGVPTGTSGAVLGFLNGNLTLSGADTFSGTLKFSGLASGTQVSCLGLDASSNVVLALAACGSGGGGAVTSVFGRTGAVAAQSGDYSFGLISGTASVGQGGTGLTSGTSGGILGFTAAGTLASSGALTANALMLGGGAGATPSTLGSLGTTTTVLHGNGAGAPSFGAVNLGTDVTGNLPLGGLATQSADTVVMNASGAAASPAAVSVGSCSAASSALTYNTSTHAFGCNTISGSGTVNSGTAGQLAGYAATGTAVSGVTLSGTLSYNTGTNSLSTVVPESTKTANYTVAAADMGGTVNLGGTGATLTIPAISSTVLAQGMSVCWANQGSGNWTISSTPTINGFNSTTVPPGGGLCVVSNGTSLDPQPAAQLPTTTQIGGVKSSTASAHQFATGISTSGAVTYGQPAFTDLSGNISTSQMNSGTGASSSTFWRGDGTWATPSGSGNVSTAGTLTNNQIVIGQGTQSVAVDANASLSAGALSLGASGTAGSIVLGNATSGTVTIQPVTGALGSVTASLPANTGTIAELNLAQVWSAAQSFNSSDLKLNGSTSGTITLNAAATAGTNTITLPAVTGTAITSADSGTVTGTMIASGVALAGSPTTTTQAANDNSTKIATTAYVDRPVPTNSGTTHTFSGKSDVFICTGACTLTVPVPSAGVQYCAMNNVGVSSAITFSAIGSSAAYGKTDQSAYGTAGTGTAVSSGAVGDKVCFIGLDSTHYNVASFNGTWTMN